MPTPYDIKLTAGQVDLVTNLIRLAAANTDGDGAAYSQLNELWEDLWSQREELGLVEPDDE